MKYCHTVTNLVFWVVCGLLGVIVLVGNFVVFIVVLADAKLRRKFMNIFLVNLACVDILMGAIVIPGYAALCSSNECAEAYQYGKYCWIMESAKDMVFLISILSLLAITYDRNLAVLHPLHYKSKITKRRMVFILLFVWLLPIPLTAVRNIWRLTAKNYREINRTYDCVLLITFVFPAVLGMTVLNTKILFAIRRQKLQTRLLNNCRISFQNENHLIEIISSRETPVKLINKLKDRSGSISCILVVTVFVVCWIPRACYNLFYLFNSVELITDELIKVSLSFLFLQSSVDPFIYVFVRKDFRKACKKLLKLLLHGKYNTVCQR